MFQVEERDRKTKLLSHLAGVDSHYLTGIFHLSDPTPQHASLVHVVCNVREGHGGRCNSTVHGNIMGMLLMHQDTLHHYNMLGLFCFCLYRNVLCVKHK